MEQLAGDLAQPLDDLHVDSAHVLGYSQGGAVAQQFAHDYPSRVRGPALGCTYAYSMLSRRERVEGMLAPSLVRILVIAGAGDTACRSRAHICWHRVFLAPNCGSSMVPAVP